MQGAASANAAGTTGLSEMKLTSIVTNSGGSGRRAASSWSNVGVLERDQVGACAQTLVQLTVPDVDRVHAPGAACEQHLGKAAGRSTDIETDASRDIYSRLLKCSREFDAAARHPGMRRRGLQRGVEQNCSRRLGNNDGVGRNQSGCGCGLRLRAAREQAALHEQLIGAAAVGHGLRAAQPRLMR